MHHFFLSFDQKPLGKQVIISSARHHALHHQIVQVLRLSVGEKLTLLNNSSTKYLYEIKQINNDKKEITLNLIDAPRENTPFGQIRLFVGIPKKDKLELIVEKCSELGINEIIPIITQRTIKNQTKTERLFKISAEAVEQSHGFYMPIIGETTELKNLQINPDDVNLIFHTQDNNDESLKDILKKNSEDQTVNIFIGPEGGFSPDDLKILNRLNNKHFIKIGERILKTETAAIVISALIKYHL